MVSRLQEIREAAESNLEVFIRLVHPNRVLGSVHKELIRWWTRLDALDHQLVLLPRDHMKSALIAYRVAWEITKNPAVRVLYISSTANLAEKQLYFIKEILSSKIYQTYWPNMINPDEGRREKWTNTEISVDHPNRRFENVRDPTVFTGGLTTVIVGMHCDIAILDDVVINDNAYTLEGRLKVSQRYSLLSSIESAEAKEWVVGTRYHPKDLYNDLVETVVETFDGTGEVSGSYSLFEVFERQVESIGDGSGEYLWPRQQRYDGKWFGFDQSILAKKKSKYRDKTQFRAQYYNDPNDPETANIRQDWFQYYDNKYLENRNGVYYFKGSKLAIYASIDFAFSLNKRADYTAIVVVGVDSKHNYYVLEIRRFRTDTIKEYFDAIYQLYSKWMFRKIRAEVTVAQAMIVQTLKEHIKMNGLALSIDEYRPNKSEGAKAERILAVLEPRYTNKQIWHYQGGNTQILEEELCLQNPTHDDVKDALASCIAFCVPPSSFGTPRPSTQIQYHSRFGGIA